MLSILIPTFNYNTYQLVKELHAQCSQITNLCFEIIVNDDASRIATNNDQINQLTHCTFYQQSHNQGLSASRNFLIEKANYNWCLFLDDDVWPRSEHFIENYLHKIKQENKTCVVFGGIEYKKDKPKSNELLRWLYGNKQEALSYKKRLTKKPNAFFSSNLLAEKSVLKQFGFPKEIETYGYEDLIFNQKVILNQIPIFQLDNPVYHEKLDTSSLFLEKSKKALENLKKAIDLGLLDANATGISKLFTKFASRFFVHLASLSYDINHKWMERNLESKHCKLFIFNCYRLLYFFKLHN